MPPRAFVDHETCRVQFHCRVGNHELDSLSIGQWPAEGDTIFGVFDHHIECALSDSYRASAMSSDPSFRDPFLGEGKSAADITNNIGDGYAHVLEENLPRRLAHHRGPLTFETDTGALEINRKARDSTPGSLFRIGNRHDLSVIGTPGAGNRSEEHTPELQSRLRM